MSDYLSGYSDWLECFADWSDVSISELHGMMTGLVCAIKPPSVDEWRLILDELSFAVPSDKALDLLAEYGEDVAFALKDNDDAYEFAPLLPDDDHELGERFLALKDWAGGFLTGVGVADMYLGKEELELLADLSKIASFRFDEHTFENAELIDNEEDFDKEEFAVEDGEETETDDTDELASLEGQYFELYEFARLVPVSLAVRNKKSVKDLALIKGLDPSRKTANELKIPPVVDVMNKH